MSTTNRTRNKFAKFTPLEVGQYIRDGQTYHVVVTAERIRPNGQGYSQDYSTRLATSEESAARAAVDAAGKVVADAHSAAMQRRANASGNC